MAGELTQAGVEFEHRIRAEISNALREGLSYEEIDKMDTPEIGEERKKIIDGVKKGIAAMYGAKSAAPAGAPVATERTVTAEQQRDLFARLETRFTSDAERYKDMWSQVRSALEAADEKALYALFQLEKSGHEVGVVAMEKGGRQGFRFDSCSKLSPPGIRDIDYFRAAEIVKEWSSGGAVDLDLMDRKLFEKLRKAGIITETGTWSHLKTEDPGSPKNPGLAWCGDPGGIRRYITNLHTGRGGFRCSLWIPAA